ncbi:uncharacterized protein LOC117656577 isoform X2 [Pantherophis guttatus]|uniref:Uncharacterized protein LOC117656577 isoform X2 n=1 Tax=Pantherophis guttatus TaxID=94885 RepID=A0ABM3YZV1_PANGU|nr:uncharacterized protein LOC117656577 isoform X2 [Pantherophis guttatus]
MALRSAPFLLLVLVAVALRESCFGASSHSLKYFLSSISDPSQGLPHFVSTGFVDGQILDHYDSHTRKVQPRVSWMEKFGKEDPQYWDRETQKARGNEEMFRRSLEILRSRYNQSEGLHIIQVMYGCELRRDGSKGGFNQHGYDGRTFLTFDKETLTWVAPDPLAQITQRKWDAIPGKNQRHKAYLEEICIEWLEKHLSYGNETLLRREPPMVTMSSRSETEDGMETHVCRVDGFYPREIDASWRRDGEVWLDDTLRGFLAPNADGTYHYWLSIQIDPKERDRYRCHVEHDSLQEPLDVALKEPTNSKSNLGLIIGCVVAALVLVGVIAGILLVFFKRRQDDYNAAPSASSHSMKFFSTGISEPSQGQPHFVIVGYVDGQVFVHYDSHTRKVQPRVSWMEKVGKEDPQYWDRESRKQWNVEETLRENLENLRSRYNQSEGFHTWQWMYGCEFQREGSKRGFAQYGYDGRTFITFDKETPTWVAPDPLAQITQRKWNDIPGENERFKSYLENICIEWLEKYLSYGNETLLRREPPMVTMSSRSETEDGMETHVCRVDGFYPREIDASWKRDGEEWLVDTHHGFLAPNADGTYHYWLSIQIDPKERDRYRCHVEHDSLQEPLDLELKEPTNSKSNLGLIIGCVVAALVLVGVIAGILVFFRRRQDDYNAAPRRNQAI